MKSTPNYTLRSIDDVGRTDTTTTVRGEEKTYRKRWGVAVVVLYEVQRTILSVL